MNIKEKILVIEKYAQLINDELGEYWLNIASLHAYSYMYDEEFSKAYETEIDKIYEYIKEFARIKVTEQTYTQKIRDVVFLDNYDGEEGDKFEEDANE
jgi:TPP-dependent indolepyruvate ferredoxin oxidoreductase alpha subunit